MVPFVRLYAYVFVRVRVEGTAGEGRVSRGCTHVARRISRRSARAAGPSEGNRR